MKQYTQAPLPFQGQKRKFLNYFKEALHDFSPTATYIDLFGGSGLLSHTVKQMFPEARVLYNDFDNYSERLDNIDKTNALLGDIRTICAQNPHRKERLNQEHSDQIISRISKEKGFVDWVTISSSILFSMNYATSFDQLKKEKFYNKVKMTDYNADGYLEGVEIVKSDYRDLFAKFKNERNVVFLVDPPYLSTDTSTYSKESYWRLSDYLNVLKVIEDTSTLLQTKAKSLSFVIGWRQMRTQEIPLKVLLPKR